MAQTPPPTERLDREDPLRQEFTARVVACSPQGDGSSVVLDQTAFYPESGGQHADRGMLGEARVRDVQVDDHGVVHHVLEGSPPDVGAAVVGRLDMVRRRRHMAQHTGQHLLSRALLDEAAAETASSRLGRAVCTLDLKVPALAAAQLRRAEDAVNAVIDADLPVRAWVPTPQELGTLVLRRRPKVDSDIRVVCAGEYDVVPCGGTHCTHTSQVELLLILGAERYKGMTRVRFLAGPPAREVARQRLDALDRLGETFTCRPDLVPGAVEKLQRDHAEATGLLGHLRRQLATLTATRLLAEGESIRGVVVALFTDRVGDPSPAFLRAVGQRIVDHPRRAVALAGATDEGVAVFVARGAESDLDCGALVRAVSQAAGGRGGGRPDHAEGRLPAECDWRALVSAYLSST